MAKVALVSSHWTPEVEQFAVELKKHSQEVVIVTDSLSPLSESYQGLVLRPFKKWNTTEAIKLYFNTFTDPIDVWHFFVDSKLAEKGFRTFLTLMSLNQAKSKPVVALSLSTSHDQVSQTKLKWLFKFCDLVTLQTREDLMYFKRNSFFSPSVQSEVWSPSQLLNREWETLHEDADLNRLIENRKPYFIIPSSRGFHKLREQAQNSHWSFVVLEKAPHQQKLDHPNFVFLNSLSLLEKLKLSAESSGWVINFEDLSNLELLDIKAICESSRSPLLCNPYQVELSPGLVRHKSTGLIVDEIPIEMNSLFQDLHRIRRNFESQEITPPNFPDTIMNEILRLYGQTKMRKLRQAESSHP